jgi:hypothetical protein
MGDNIVHSTESSWGNFANYLTNAFKTQYGAQSSIFGFLTNKFTEMVNNPTGFSQQALSALRGGAVQQIATQFNNARQGVAATQSARGDFGGDVKSGINAQISGQIAGQQAGATAGGLDQIEQQNEQLKIENQRIAEQGLNQIGVEENPTGFAGAATSAASETGQLGMINNQIDQTGFLSQLGSSFARGLGSGAGKLLSGSAGGFFGMGGAGSAGGE